MSAQWAKHRHGMWHLWFVCLSVKRVHSQMSVSIRCRAWSQKGLWTSIQSTDVKPLFFVCVSVDTLITYMSNMRVSEWDREPSSTSFIWWHFCRCQVQCVIVLWARSMPGLEGTSQGSIIQPARQTVAPGLWRGVHIPVTPGKKVS